MVITINIRGGTMDRGLEGKIRDYDDGDRNTRRVGVVQGELLEKPLYSLVFR
jgi:hypothetical protein